LRHATDPGALLPLLHRLVKSAPEGSETFAFAHRNLAEILVDRDPWRAALHARRATHSQPEDDRGWAALGLCHTLLGNYRAAASAYHKASACAPGNPWYAHNLGHLLDVALGRPKEAVLWLKMAYENARRDGEIATSYAQALARAGQIAEARRVLKRAMKRNAHRSQGAKGTREQSALLRWLDDGASESMRPARTAGRVQLRDGSSEIASKKSRNIPAGPKGVRSTREDARKRALADVGNLLDRGLARLPLDEHQRERAHAMAAEAIASRIPADDAQQRVLAAAIAYAVVYEVGVPLSATEVASTFRVSAASLRGRFASLRTRLAISPLKAST